MKGNFHVRFLEGGGLATARSYSVFSGINFCTLLRPQLASRSAFMWDPWFSTSPSRKVYRRSWKVVEGAPFTHHASRILSGITCRRPRLEQTSILVLSSDPACNQTFRAARF